MSKQSQKNKANKERKIQTNIGDPISSFVCKSPSNHQWIHKGTKMKYYRWENTYQCIHCGAYLEV